jgi:hypothetical protein
VATARDEYLTEGSSRNGGSAEAFVRETLASLMPAGMLEHPDAAALRAERIDGARAQPAIVERRLVAAAGVLDLTDIEFIALVLTSMTELDPGVSAAVALLQGTPPLRGSDRPTIGLLAAVAEKLANGRRSDAASALSNGFAVRTGLLRLGRAEGPLHARTLEIPPTVLAALLEDDPRADEEFGDASVRLIVAPKFSPSRRWSAVVDECAAHVGAGFRRVVLRGPDAAALRLLAADLAASFDMHAAEIELHQSTSDYSALFRPSTALQAWLGVTSTLPVIVLETTPGERVKLPRSERTLLLVLAAPGVSVDAADDLVEIEVPTIDGDDRCAICEAICGRALTLEERAVVGAMRCGIGVLMHAARLIARSHGLSVSSALNSALRSQARELAAWAQVSSDTVAEDALVGTIELRRTLDLLRSRCLERGALFASLGEILRGRELCGVKALFVGASGTGKTMAAQWLADRLGRPLVRIDLAGVVSKYIGETEKNLARLLERAERLDAVLLFDEADSLFGARTDVRQANDRYANMQTNYLLQRLETFSGIAILTSNSKGRFDDSFLRRLDAIVEFALPTAEERRELWRAHLGSCHAVDEAALGALAALVDLPGGHIRNVVVEAAMLARRRGAGTAIVYEDVVEAVPAEFAKLGRRAPDGLR